MQKKQNVCWIPIQGFTSLALPDLTLTQPKDLGIQSAKQAVKCIMYYLLAVFRDDLVPLARYFLIIFLLL